MHRLSLLCAAAVAASMPAAPGPAAGAAADQWGPLQEAGGSALAVALDDGTTALVSVGGADDATVYDQRRTQAGTLGPQTTITTVDGVEACRPVEAATAVANFAVAVECRQKTGLEDPPTTIVELVWTGDDGWVRRVQREASLGSVDYSPHGQYALFTSNSWYGRAHHLSSYHADLGWQDLTRRELGFYGDTMVGAVTDGGNVVALRGAGSEDEPGYWLGGRLGIETYQASADRWTTRLKRTYPDGGIRPAAIDVSEGRIAATVVEARSTGQVDGRDERLVLLSGRPDAPRTWSPSGWSRRVLAASTAATASGVAVAGWQTVDDARHTVTSWFGTWAARSDRPSVHDLRWYTTLTDAAALGRAMDLSVSDNGHGAIGYLRHRPGTRYATVAAVAFRVGRNGDLHGQVDATLRRRPARTTVAVTAGATSSSITLGATTGLFTTSPLTQYSVGP